MVNKGYLAASFAAERGLSMRRQSSIQDDVHGRRVHGGMLVACSEPGCTTLTMGGTCVAHDPPATIVFPRGRPFVAATPAREGPLTLAS
jgi:hypothetical protein